MKPAPVCHVPDCGKPARLYPAGWLCEDHKPGTADPSGLTGIETKQEEARKS